MAIHSNALAHWSVFIKSMLTSTDGGGSSWVVVGAPALMLFVTGVSSGILGFRRGGFVYGLAKLAAHLESIKDKEDDGICYYQY